MGVPKQNQGWRGLARSCLPICASSIYANLRARTINQVAPQWTRWGRASGPRFPPIEYARCLSPLQSSFFDWALTGFDWLRAGS